jgi:hypothetical protein
LKVSPIGVLHSPSMIASWSVRLSNRWGVSGKSNP